MKEKEENWKEDRRWMNNDVRTRIEERNNNNREYRKMRKLYSVNDERTQRPKMR